MQRQLDTADAASEPAGAATRARPVVRALLPGVAPDPGPQRVPPSAPPARLAAWLANLCRQIPNLEQSIALLDTVTDRTPLCWPAAADDPALEALARHARSAGTTQVQPGPSASTARIACPVRLNGRVTGAVAVRTTGLARHQHALVAQILDWGSSWLDLMQQTPDLEDTDSSAALAAEALDSILRDVSSALDHPRFADTTLAIASSVAHHLCFTRVSIGTNHAGKVTLAAVSDTALPTPRTAFAVAMRAAMRETALHGSAVHVARTGTTASDLAAHRALLAETGSSLVIGIPMRFRGEICTVMVLERADETPVPPSVLEACDALAGVLGPALELKRQLARRGVARVSLGVRGITVMLALLAGAVALGALPVEFRVSAPARVEGSVQRVVVAPFDGYIEEAHARAGDRVAEGELLATLQQSTLLLERATWAGERDESEKAHRRALATRDRAEALVLEARMAQAQARVDLLDAQIARTRIVSPFAGIVITGDLSRSLGAPVQRGETLFELAPADDHRIALQVDERDVSEIAPGMQGQLALAALPEETYPFTIERVSRAARTESGQPLFVVEARLDDGASALRPGMEGVAKIDIEQRALVWVLTHRLVDWLALRLWSLWP